MRGTVTPQTLLRRANATVAASFTTNAGFSPGAGTSFAFPTDADFVSWPQGAAILRRAPHPEAAKLLHSWILTPEVQRTLGWSVRADVPPPPGFPDIMGMRNTNVTAFGPWMMDRDAVERLRLSYEDLLGTPRGLSPLVDGI